MDMLDVVKRLIGDISPCGESNIDEERLENFKELLSLTEEMIGVIETNLRHSKRQEASVQEFGKRAEKWFKDIGDAYFQEHLKLLKTIQK